MPLVSPMIASASQRAALAARLKPRPIAAPAPRPSAPITMVSQPAPEPAQPAELTPAGVTGHVARAERWAGRNAMDARAKAIRVALASRFPLCFKPFGAVKVPLAIGIDRAVITACPDLDSNDVANAVNDYCNGRSYLQAVVAGAVRINLAGEPAGVVRPVDEGFARGRLKKLTAAR
jgi:ProP effector